MSGTVTGIDVGADAIKVARLRVDADGQLEVVAMGCEPLEEVAQLPDSPEKVDLVRKRLKGLLRREGIRAGHCVLSVSGRPTRIGYEIVPIMPQWRLAETMAFQADQQISQSAASSYDYRILDVGDIAGQYVVMLGLAQETLVCRRLDDAGAAGASDSDVDFSALALFNTYEAGHGVDEDETVCIVDVGAAEVGTVIVRKGALVFARSHAGGGGRFTSALEEAFGIPGREAETFKRERGEVRAGGPGANGSAARPTHAPGSKEEEEAKKDEDRSSPGDPNATAEILFDETREDKSLELQSSVDETEALRPERVTPARGMPAIRMGPGGTGERRAFRSLSREQANLRGSQVLTREAAVLCATIDNSIRFCQRELKLPNLRIDRILITGGGGRLKGLVEFMARRLRAKVEPLIPLRQISLGSVKPARLEKIEPDVDRCAVAVGLAASRLRENTFSFSLLPKSVKQRRDFMAKDLYLYAAAVLFVLAMALYLYRPFRDNGIQAANVDLLTNTLAADKVATERLDEVAMRNDQLVAEVRAIEERVYSGRDLLRVLSQLKKLTVPEIWFVEMTTLPPEQVQKAIKENYKAAGGKGPLPAALTGETFQEIRSVFLRGYARAQGQSKAQARNRIVKQVINGKFLPNFIVVDADGKRRVRDDLSGLIHDVIVRVQDPDVQEYEGYYVMSFILEVQLVKP